MMASSQEECGKLVAEKRIQWVDCQFLDMDGRLKTLTLPGYEFAEGSVWKHGVAFDGAAVRGMTTPKHSDMFAFPDPSTFIYMQGRDHASILCDIRTVDGEPSSMDSRGLARRATERSVAEGFPECWMFAELEFFLFESAAQAIEENAAFNRDMPYGPGSYRQMEKPGSHDRPGKGYLASPPHDKFESVRSELSSVLQGLGYLIRYHHHECGARQLEIEYRALPNAVLASDAVVRYKQLAREISSKQGLVPTFMPKPVFADAGSGMHVQQYLAREGKSLFHDPDDKHRLSQAARYYIGGILEHAPYMAAITNPTVNSYKRLVPEFEAPIFAAWSPMNRTALVRIPAAGMSGTSEVEVRHPDSTSNPYLTHGLLLWCGLDGIKRKLDPGDPINENIHRIPKERRKQMGIKGLPLTLGDAVEAMLSDDVLKEALGPDLFGAFYEEKRKEWRMYCAHVSEWEHYHYFDA
ncbi:MAG: type I glutamate--ammonia ligase [Euryarchaeota archaeon]|nr:type I glutamate--ammonia ligase [Euryarchaeota archaeon]